VSSSFQHGLPFAGRRLPAIGLVEPAPSNRGTDPAAIPPQTDSLARHLLRSVCGVYILVILVVTAFQIGTAYFYAEARLEKDIGALDGTFGQGLADAVWGLNEDVIGSILAGMVRLPEVAGVTVQDEHGARIAMMGMIRDVDGGIARVDRHGHATPGREGFMGRLFARDFDLVHADGHGRRSVIGNWTVYSDRRTVREQVRTYIVVALGTAVVKGLALSLITLVVVRRIIGLPLRQLSDHVAGLDIDNLAATPLSLKGRGRNELHVLAGALNLMTAKIRRSVEENARLVKDLEEMNATLQSRVAERTQELERLAATDQLTGLANRRKLDELLVYEAARANRHRHPLSIAIADVDHFKAVNDTHGHQAGDVVLIAVGHLLRAAIRETDTAGRWGGEEFLIVSPQVGLDGALQMAERLRERIAHATLPAVGSKTCSFGVAELRPGETIEEMVRRADAALYRAKRSGRNRVVAAD
jgi:diguanylate cyclase (GGDEF)-like protein